MSALRVARAATKRDRVIKFEGCYHGHADPFLVKAGSGALTHGVPTSPGVPARSDAGYAGRALQRPRVGRATGRRQNRGQIAAVIVEPIAGNMGVVPPRDRFLEGLRALCNRDGIILIFDEVITGFRVAPGGAQQALQVRADLTCLGKIIGGGLPVGAYGGRADLMELVSPAGPVYQAGTLSGNPLAMTAGLWSLEALSPGLYRHLAKLGATDGWSRRRRATGRSAAADQRIRIGADTVLYRTAGSRLRVGVDLRHRAICSVLPRDAGEGRLSTAVAVRRLVPLRGPHGARCRSHRAGGRRSIQAALKHDGQSGAAQRSKTFVEAGER